MKGKNKAKKLEVVTHLEEKVEVIPVEPMPLICCGEHMSRLNCGGDDLMCCHFRLLMAPCKQCKSDHGGILTWRCNKCGREYRDAPHILTGPAALAINYGVK